MSLSLLIFGGCMEQGFSSRPPLYQGTEPTPADPVIRITPEHHDFGVWPIGCGRVRPFEIANVGTADLFVEGLDFVTSSDELVLDGGDLFPLTIEPGKHVVVEVTYKGMDAVDDFAEIVATSNDPARPEAKADMRGASVSAPVVDRFEQPEQPRTDVLVVIDNSGSMDEEQNGLTTNFQTFVDQLVSAGADFHLAVITTDVPRFVGPVITGATADPVGAFTQQVRSIGIDGSGDEMPLQMVVDATSPGGDAAPGGTFLRDEAALAVIVVTDEPDEFSPMSPSAFVNHLVGLEDGDASRVAFHTIGSDVPVPACQSASNPSVPLDEVTDLTGGIFASVCSNWGNTLTALGAAAVPLATQFPLSGEPVEGTVSVTVDGAPVTSGWTLDPAGPTVVFEPGSVPPGGAVVEVSFEPTVDCAAWADTP